MNKKNMSAEVKAIVDDSVKYGGEAEAEAKIGLNVGLQTGGITSSMLMRM